MTPNNSAQPNNQNNQNLAPFDLTITDLNKANNVLVTISASPSLDQLSALLGLTLFLNKIGKRATAVFSGKVPSAIDFLKPEKTIEKNTDSLRDFIIALDKEKADKLRYKVEDDVVKIYISPYKTSISEKDLHYSQGDFNIDTVVTIGVKDRSHLDGAITANGRILHDATVIAINLEAKSQFAAVDWVEPRASSLSEMISDITLAIKRDSLDNQISSALLTGIVSETDRFKNNKVSPHTMSIAGILMASGASPQLIADKLEQSKLEEEKKKASLNKPTDKHNLDGAIKIRHTVGNSEDDEQEEKENEELPEQPSEKPEERDNIHIDEQGTLYALEYDREKQVALQKSEEAEKIQNQQNQQQKKDDNPTPANTPSIEKTDGKYIDKENIGNDKTLNDIESEFGSGRKTEHQAQAPANHKPQETLNTNPVSPPPPGPPPMMPPTP